MKRLLIIKCGDTIPELVARRGDFENWIIDGCGLTPADTLTVNVENNEPLPAVSDIAGVIISGSHAMVTEHRPWSEMTAEWLARTVGEVPALGICYGHQLLGYALGGTVADNPRGREIGTVEIALSPASNDDRLLGGNGSSIKAQVSHKQSLIDLPPGAVHLARSEWEPNQAFRYGENAWGVQFHPEFDADITTSYVDYCAGFLREEGQDPDSIRDSCRDTPAGDTLLKSFRRVVFPER
mgnify:CR=1 FL=1